MTTMTLSNERKSRKVIQKKAKKRQDLLEEAFKLFLAKGVDQTSIDDIVSSAGVAKGTFYLYFKDKFDLIEQIIIRSTGEIILKVYRDKQSEVFACFEDLVIAVLDEIINKLCENPSLLSLIHRNVNWHLYQKALRESSGESLLDLLKNDERRFNRNQHIGDEEFERRMFIILEMTTAITYTTVVRNEPRAIDEIKPTLYAMIRKAIAAETT